MLHKTLVNNRIVTYWEGGNPQGKPVLFIHGLGGDHRGLLDCTTALSEHRLLIPDLPGYGLSETFEGLHTIDAYVNFIESFLVNLKLTNIVLVGYSFGGSVGLTFAKTYPNRLHKLVLLNPAISTPRSLLGRAGKICMSAMSLLPEVTGHWLATNKFTVYVSDLAVMTAAGKPYRKKILQDDYESYRLTSFRALREGVRSLDTTSRSSFIAETTIDTTLIAAARDSIVHVNLSRALADVLKAHYLEMEGGHLLPLERPLLVGQILAQALQ